MEPLPQPSFFLCDEQLVNIRLPQNLMMVVTQFPELLPSVFLSFHDPFEEYMVEIEMD
jgi:hypothetical protein